MHLAEPPARSSPSRARCPLRARGRNRRVHLWAARQAERLGSRLDGVRQNQLIGYGWW